MDELQALLGDAYKEGITVEEIGDFFKGKKFADLSTGNYVDKNKYTNEVNNLTSQLNQTKQELDNKLTDEEKNSKVSQEKDNEIERLKQMLSANTISGNKNTVNSIMTSSRDILGISADDSDFSSFVENITTEDTEKSTSIANYFAKVVKEAYDKGKDDATKDSMGDFGKGKGQQGSDEGDEIGQMGKKLAALNKSDDKKKYDYFNKEEK